MLKYIWTTWPAFWTLGMRPAARPACFLPLWACSALAPYDRSVVMQRAHCKAAYSPIVMHTSASTQFGGFRDKC